MAQHPYTSPLTYAKCEQLWAKKRKSNDFKKINYACRLYKNSDGTFSYVMHSTVIARVEPDDTLTLNSGGWITHPTTKEEMSHVCGIGIWSNSKANLEQTIRIGNLPWMEGTRVRNRLVLDQHKHVDRTRVADRKKMAEIRKQLAPLVTLGRTLLRFGVTSEDVRGARMSIQEITNSDLSKPTAEMVYALMYHPQWTEHINNDRAREWFEQSVRVVRENLYMRGGARQWEELPLAA